MNEYLFFIPLHVFSGTRALHGPQEHFGFTQAISAEMLALLTSTLLPVRMFLLIQGCHSNPVFCGTPQL